jgi:hypothetical protein
VKGRVTTTRTHAEWVFLIIFDVGAGRPYLGWEHAGLATINFIIVSDPDPLEFVSTKPFKKKDLTSY